MKSDPSRKHRKYPVRVLVVDDSALIRRHLTRALSASPFLQVVGTASDGIFALEKIRDLAPDVVTLDLHMPRMDGLEALKRIMQESPLPVIMFSSVTREGAELTFRALRLGAVDFMPKPMGSLVDNLRKINTELVTKILAASTSNFRNMSKKEKESSVLQYSKGYDQTPLWRRDILIPVENSSDDAAPFFALGCSTGGPQALERIIGSLPGNFESSIGIVQHMPEPFLSVYAEHLNSISEIEVKVATPFSQFEPGSALLAPGNAHMKIHRLGNKLFASLQHLEVDELGKFPSVDFFFSSVARSLKKKAVGIILSGMGKDGTKGLRAIKMLGGFTIAQDRASSVVYGMPGTARAEGLIDHVSDPESIAWMMVSLARHYRPNQKEVRKAGARAL